MRTIRAMAVLTVAAVLGGILVPALAQSPPTMMPDGGMGTARHGHGTSGGMMSGGCGGMMHSMNGGGGRPNSQWQNHPPGDGSMVN